MTESLWLNQGWNFIESVTVFDHVRMITMETRNSQPVSFQLMKQKNFNQSQSEKNSEWKMTNWLHLNSEPVRISTVAIALSLNSLTFSSNCPILTLDIFQNNTRSSKKPSSHQRLVFLSNQSRIQMHLSTP